MEIYTTKNDTRQAYEVLKRIHKPIATKKLRIQYKSTSTSTTATDLETANNLAGYTSHLSSKDTSIAEDPWDAIARFVPDYMTREQPHRIQEDTRDGVQTTKEFLTMNLTHHLLGPLLCHQFSTRSLDDLLKNKRWDNNGRMFRCQLF